MQTWSSVARMESDAVNSEAAFLGLDLEKEFGLVLDSVVNSAKPQEIHYSIRAMSMQQYEPNSFYSCLADALVVCHKRYFLNPVQHYYEASLCLHRAELEMNKNSSAETTAFEMVKKIADRIFDKYEFSLAD